MNKRICKTSSSTLEYLYGYMSSNVLKHVHVYNVYAERKRTTTKKKKF